MPAAEAVAMLDPMLPAQLDYYIATSFAIYGGPIMLVTGALLGTGDYRWGALRTFASRSAGRVTFATGRLLDGAAIDWPSAAER